ncbi:hypothetical protein SAMN05421811_102467 [Nonomuraea wenchangensis]|uniref:Uncharacterized protein n=1 Tax=Nonomuraea wenchangensis TaxID=568860 RepID=A0A1I0CVK3_9ACTN|nr:hypothetical protein SAMN05421811_102467 [Nonomuraea wenchangensis]
MDEVFHNYPPDQEAKAIDLAIRQINFASIWSKNGRVR